MYFNTENYLKGFYVRNKIAIDKVNRLITLNLSYREKRKLISLIRTYNVRSKEAVKNINSLLYVKINGDYRKHLEKAAEIIKLYEKAGLVETEWVSHWEYHIKDQHIKHFEAKSNIKVIRQDNKNYINRGNGDSYSGDIRYPNLKRKTAWKRFYKLFPSLKPTEEIEETT